MAWIKSPWGFLIPDEANLATETAALSLAGDLIPNCKRT